MARSARDRGRASGAAPAARRLPRGAAADRDGRTPDGGSHAAGLDPGAAIDRAGVLLWAVEIDPPSFGQVVQAADGTLYVGTETGKLQAIDRDGVRWSFETAGPIPTPAIGPDGTIYTRGGDGALYAIRADGRRRWTTDIGAEPRRLGPAPLIGPDDYYPGEARMDRLQSGADPHQADRTWEGTRCHRWATWATSWKSILPPERSRPPS